MTPQESKSYWILFKHDLKGEHEVHDCGDEGYSHLIASVNDNGFYWLAELLTYCDAEVSFGTYDTPEYTDYNVSVEMSRLTMVEDGTGKRVDIDLKQIDKSEIKQIERYLKGKLEGQIIEDHE